MNAFRGMFDFNNRVHCIQAVFSDETAQFRSPANPTAEDAVCIYIRVGRDTVSEIYFCGEKNEQPMHKAASQGVFEYYFVTLPPEREKEYYFFRLFLRGEELFYTKYGVFQDYQTEGWFCVNRDYQVPSWANGALIYQIFPDRFCDGDKSSNVLTGEYTYLGKAVEAVSDWNALPEAEDVHRFYGGDLQGILDKLDYFKALGVEALYLNPIFISPSNHKYDIQDYEHIDPHLGKIASNQEATYKNRTTLKENLEANDRFFAEFVSKMHDNGIRVVLDGVFNHCGGFHKWLDREGLYDDGRQGAYRNAESPYREYFHWKEDGTYEGWWNHKNHPKLNYEGSAKLCEEIFSAAKKWISPPYNADGWRLDVAADLGKSQDFNHKFWKKFRETIKEVSPDVLILAEHYGDAMPWLQGDQWDSVMNYDGFMEPLGWFLTGISKHSDYRREDLYNNAGAFWGSMVYQMSKLPVQALYSTMNQLSNHDHARFLTRTNGQVGRLDLDGAKAAEEYVSVDVLKEAVLFQMTWIGSPTIYYGDEAGVCGWTDPDNRRTYPWGRENHMLIDYHKSLIRIRKENSVLRYGSWKQLFGEDGVIGFGRFDRSEKIVVLINNTIQERAIVVPVWQIGVVPNGRMTEIFKSYMGGFSEKQNRYDISEGNLICEVPAKGGLIVKEV